MSCLLIAALIGGRSKAVRIGEMLLFSSILALLIAIAPATVHLLHGG
jgi:hypothetical protein